ncbi:MAG: hypothetical protein ABSC01_08655 [Verrucomicrobiota bacterium]
MTSSKSSIGGAGWWKRSEKLFNSKPWASLKVLIFVAVRASKPPKSTSIGADIWCRNMAANSSGRQSLARSSPVAINAASSFARLLNTAAEESNSDITVLLSLTGRFQKSCTLFSTPFRQSNEKIFQCQNLDCHGGILSRVFLNHLAQMRLENAFGAQQRIGGICRGFQTEPVNQLVIGHFSRVIENGFEQANAEHFPNIAAPGLVFAGIFAICLHPPQCLGEHSACPSQIKFFRGCFRFRQFLFQFLQRNRRVLYFNKAQMIQDKISQTRFQKITKSTPALIRLSQPALFEQFVLSKILKQCVSLILQAGECRH